MSENGLTINKLLQAQTAFGDVSLLERINAAIIEMRRQCRKAGEPEPSKLYICHEDEYELRLELNLRFSVPLDDDPATYTEISRRLGCELVVLSIGDFLVV